MNNDQKKANSLHAVSLAGQHVKEYVANIQGRRVYPTPEELSALSH